MITLTPWDPQELYPLLSMALARRPAVIAPFVTRPHETVPDRERLGLAPVTASLSGVYVLRQAKGRPDAVVVLQGSDVAMEFVHVVLPHLDRDGIDLQVVYVASVELFDALTSEQRTAIFPDEHAREAMGITGFTLPTMYRWIRSEAGREHTLHPFRRGHYLGSGQASAVLAEAGLDGESLLKAVRGYVDARVGAV
jgi:transketolase